MRTHVLEHAHTRTHSRCARGPPTTASRPRPRSLRPSLQAQTPHLPQQAALPPPPSKSAGLGIRALGRARPPQNCGVPLWGHSNRALAAPQSPSCFMSHSRRAGSTASAPTLAAWKPQVPIQRLPGQSGLARQDSGPVDSTGPWPGLLTEGAVLLGAHGPRSPAAGEQGPAALLAEGLGGQGPAVFGYRQSWSLSRCFIPGATPAGRTRQPPGPLAPRGTEGSFCGTGTAALRWALSSGPTSLPSSPGRGGSERPSPLSTARGSTAERAGPATVRAAREGPASSGQHCQDGPCPHRR